MEVSPEEESHRFDLLASELPSDFKTVLVKDNEEKYELRANLENETHMVQWIREFGKCTQTQWNFRRSRYGSRIISREFVCHQSRYAKVPADENGCNKRGVSKNADCLARLKITINVQASRRTRDQFVKNGLWATIRIDRKHTHTLKEAKILRFLQDKDGTLRDSFFEYFGDGMAASEAKHFHEHQLKLNNASEKDFANGSSNPTIDTVSYWFKQWRTQNIATRTQEQLISKLEEKRNIYAELGIILEYTIAPFSVLMLTPTMLRAHKLSSSADLVFINTTKTMKTCDADAYSVTFIFTPCAVGAVPLAMFITKGQNNESYSAAFNLIKTALPDGFGNQGFPSIAVTDNVAVEIDAFENTWPDTKTLLCVFRMLQEVWRWLWDSVNKIKPEDRIQLMNSFKKVMYAENLTEMENAYSNCVNYGTKYDKWIKFIAEHWKYKQKWALSYRNDDIRQHLTNNFTETSIRIFKDDVFARVKPNNVITLVHVTATHLDDYYDRKMRNYANFLDKCSYSFLRENMQKVSYLCADDILQIDQFLYLVPSEKNRDELYTVDCQVGSCSCMSGKSGSFCKHQAAVYQYFTVFLTNFPAITVKNRHKMAQVSLGDNAPEISFYEDFETLPCAENIELSAANDSVVSPSSSMLDVCMISVEDEKNVDLEECLEYVRLIQNIQTTVGNKIRRYSTSRDIAALNTFRETLQDISSEEMLMKFLHSASMPVNRLKNGTKNNVQSKSPNQKIRPTCGSQKIISGRVTKE
ncbi:uncharacterized protein LOC135843445 [Planococcus citri]|uniref:uncharacterized protein LOC135843445 n=1 Tax=Planococcus citri TaxID=170843 RepID=UPI0031F9052F